VPASRRPVTWPSRLARAASCAGVAPCGGPSPGRRTAPATSPRKVLKLSASRSATITAPFPLPTGILPCRRAARYVRYSFAIMRPIAERNDMYGPKDTERRLGVGVAWSEPHRACGQIALVWAALPRGFRLLAR
jgi:hypothetical protein